MSPSAKNLVLLGDQMQLGQPIRGSHPAESGQSALEYLLGAHRTIPADLGIFLATTWRLHPSLCSFISGAIYEDKLAPEAGTVDVVVRAVGSRSAAIRGYAVRTLAAAASVPSAAVGPLVTALADASAAVRGGAAKALGTAGAKATAAARCNSRTRWPSSPAASGISRWKSSAAGTTSA